MTEFLLRDARMSDIDDIFALSALLNTVNLPANKKYLEQVISNSESSFSMREEDATKRAFLFVLIGPDDRVIGTSQIFAKHGTPQVPHLYFQVDIDERYSETLKKYFRHSTLRLCQSLDGPTEVGSLVLDPLFRSSVAKHGSSLSYVRFLFMGIKPKIFSHRVIAELLPPLGPNLESSLWNAIGRRFTGLEYYEADMLSRKNKEFIRSLFPTCEIYVSLLPEEAREVIGQVGAKSKGAAHLLSKIGFRYNHRVDPFDGGPHFEAELDEISLIRSSHHSNAKMLNDEFANFAIEGLCGRYDATADSGHRFLACKTKFYFDRHSDELHVQKDAFFAMGLRQGDAISAVSMMANV